MGLINKILRLPLRPKRIRMMPAAGCNTQEFSGENRADAFCVVSL